MERERDERKGERERENIERARDERKGKGKTWKGEREKENIERARDGTLEQKWIPRNTRERCDHKNDAVERIVHSSCSFINSFLAGYMTTKVVCVKGL